jgi:hypothetical protein
MALSRLTSGRLPDTDTGAGARDVARKGEGGRGGACTSRRKGANW